MKKYILVHEPIDPNESPSILLDNSILEKKQKPSGGRQWVNFGCMK